MFAAQEFDENQCVAENENEKWDEVNNKWYKCQIDSTSSRSRLLIEDGRAMTGGSIDSQVKDEDVRSGKECSQCPCTPAEIQDLTQTSKSIDDHQFYFIVDLRESFLLSEEWGLQCNGRWPWPRRCTSKREWRSSGKTLWLDREDHWKAIGD